MKHTTSRIDYILALPKIADLMKACAANQDIDLATKSRDDHRVLECQFEGVLGQLEAEAAAKG
eukprot:6261640-Pyramimonas_sp.AAC.1